MIVALYLLAIVAANLSIAHFGPVVAPLNALVFIGLDLTARDALHERWRGRYLAPKMLALIAAGGALSWLLNRDALTIAIASTVAFVVAASLDGLAYALLARQPRAVRVNASNVIGAAADSLIFPALAFGSVAPAIVLPLFLAKVLGGFAWSVVLMHRASRRVVA